MKKVLLILLFLLTAHCSLLTVFAQGTTTFPTALDDNASLPVPVDAKVATLTVGLTSSATTATVNSTTGFSAKGVITIESEQIAYTGLTATTFTGLTRGFGGTTARPHSINVQIRTPIVSAHITGARGAVVELEEKLGIGASDASAASTGHVLTKQGDGTTAWQAPGAGSGDVVGPASSVDDRIATFDGVTGKLIQDGGSTIAQLQPIDATLTALAAYNTNGLLTQTSADTFTGRSIAVHADANLTVTDGNGVAGNPTLNTIQGIKTISSPTFAGVTINSSTGLLVFSQSAQTEKATIQQIAGSFQMSANAQFDGAAWQRYNTALPSWNLFITPDANDAFIVRRTAAGAGAITWTNFLKVTSAGHLVFGADNTYDIGASGATRPRTGYFGTSLVSPLFQSDSVKILLKGTGAGAAQLATAQTTAPTCSTNCGTSPSVVGSDTFMKVTMGSSGSPASGWVVTFNGTWAAAPACVASMGKAGMAVGKLPLTVVTTVTTITVVTNGTAPATTDVYHIHCGGTQ